MSNLDITNIRCSALLAQKKKKITVKTQCWANFRDRIIRFCEIFLVPCLSLVLGVFRSCIFKKIENYN